MFVDEIYQIILERIAISKRIAEWNLKGIAESVSEGFVKKNYQRNNA